MPDWNWGPVLPRSCSAFGCAARSTGVITIGGTYWISPEKDEPSKRWVRDVYWLASGASAWERLPDYPRDVGQVLAVSINDRIYAIGGRDAENAFRETYWISPDDFAAGWQRGPDLPRPFFALGGGTHGGTIYAVTDEIAMREPGGPAPPPPTVLALDTAETDAAWVELGHAPDGEVGYHTVAVADGKLFLFGGAVQRGDEALELRDSVWSFDLQSKKWSARHPLPYPLRDASAVQLNQKSILIAGGVEDAASFAKTPDDKPRILLSNRCLLYDTEADQFTFAAPLRLAVADHGLVTLDSAVLAIAGEDSPYRTRTDLVQVARVDALLQTATNNASRFNRLRLSPHDRGPRSRATTLATTEN
ncbi:MAG: kelch repeat-containing protein [Pirellulales bacterium]